jgi:hypothetical protein
MNQPIDPNLDEHSLAQYLKRDSEYSTQYRNVPVDDVPPELDHAVMAQATSAVRVIVPKLQTWRRFTMPMTLAATLVLAVSIVLNVRQNEAPIESDTPNKIAATPLAVEADIAAPEAPALPAIAASSESLEAARPERRERQAKEAPLQAETKSKQGFAADLNRRSDSVVQPPPPSPVIQQQAPPTEVAAADAVAPALKMASAPAAAEVRAVETAATTRELEEVVVTAQQIPAASSAGGPRSNVPAAGQSYGLSDREKAVEREANPQQWLKYIRDLRAVNRNIEANREWERFIKAYPTHPVAETDAARPKP